MSTDAQVNSGVIALRVLLGASIWYMAAPLACGGDNGVLKVRILETWAQRQARVKSLDFTWKGVRLGIDDAAIDPADIPNGSKLPPKNATYAVEMRLILDGQGRGRFNYVGKTWSYEKGELVPRSDICIFDGKLGTVHFPQGTGVLNYACASIANGSLNRAVSDFRCKPLLLVYRPLDVDLGMFDASQFAISENDSLVNGRKCAQLIYPLGDGRSRIVSVDTAEGFFPVRYQQIERGAVTQSLDIKYSPNAEWGMTPTSWTDSWVSGDGGIYRSISATVSSHSLNDAVSDEIFRLAFSPGTWVQNTITGESYIVRENGEKRQVVAGEYTGQNYDQLLNSETPATGIRWMSPMVVANAFAAAAIGFICFAWIKRRR